jgi:hypothetical protein
MHDDDDLSLSLCLAYCFLETHIALPTSLLLYCVDLVYENKKKH